MPRQRSSSTKFFAIVMFVLTDVLLFGSGW